MTPIIPALVAASLLSALLDPLGRAIKRLVGDAVQKGKDAAQKELDAYKDRLMAALSQAEQKLDAWIAGNAEDVTRNRDAFIGLLRDKVLESVPEETWPPTIQLFFFGLLDTVLLPALRAVVSERAAPTAAKVRENIRKEFDRARARIKGWRL